MVKKLLRFFAFSLFFLFALVLFTPKDSFYFLLEQELEKLSIIISNETLQERLLSLNVQNLEINTKGVDTLVVREADVMLLLFYNTINFQNLQISSLVSAYIPPRVDTLDLRYTIFNPLVLTAKAKGEFGHARAEFSLLDKELKLFVMPSKLMLHKYKKTLQMLKKDENGEYIYAKTF